VARGPLARSTKRVKDESSRSCDWSPMNASLHHLQRSSVITLPLPHCKRTVHMTPAQNCQRRRIIASCHSRQLDVVINASGDMLRGLGHMHD